ncbi:hypothetical protein PIB30_105756 [Stylosanthes scabra]|uniref:Uncharacterized protein n=1 Tax=Stylosanthes scabra TaxID=79078 RepID=A0ABU6W0Q4_9FABA|nr:hypothetical protein [Stylosanthes scabra]
MGRRKTTARKPARTSRKELPPLSHLPLRKWFTSNEIWKSYLDTFSKLPVLKPRYLPEGLIPENRFGVFWEIVDQQDLRPLLHMREREMIPSCSGVFLAFRYHPRLMRVVATTLQLKDSLDDIGNGEFYLRFWITSVTYIITLDELASVKRRATVQGRK